MMKKMSGSITKLTLVLLISLAYTVSTARSDVSLQLPEHTKIIAINGKSDTISGDVQLPDGINQIALRLQVVFNRRGFRDTHMEYSDVFVIKFKALNETLDMRIPTIKSSNDLKEFNDQPDFRIVNGAGNAIQIHWDRLVKEGWQIGRDYEKELRIFNTTNSSAAVKPMATDGYREMPQQVSTAQPVESPQTANQKDHIISPGSPTSPPVKARPQTQHVAPLPSDGSNLAEQMLKYWYLQADEETRERFKVWIGRH